MIEELTQTISQCEKKNIKLDIEKKKAAALKKFKEAQKAQQDIKECTQQMEESQAHLSIIQAEKLQIEADVILKD